MINSEKLEKFPSHIINGEEIYIKGNDVTSFNPYTGDVLWSTSSADKSLIDEAIKSANDGFRIWSCFTLNKRKEIIKNFTKIVEDEKPNLINIVAREAGKPFWEASIEVNALVTKLTASIEAYEKRNTETSREVKGLLSKTRFKPHGVLGVLGPFNFPLSMANGHIMPALLAGNSIVFKPSELTPLCGIVVSQMWQKAGLPKGVLNCITGGSETGKYLVGHKDVDGILFVGSHTVGISILNNLANFPNKIVALEMGGNSPLIVEDFDEKYIKEVVSIIIHSSFITSGQRCSAARRLLVNKKNKKLLSYLVEVSKNLKIGNYTDSPEPFYGPMIRPAAALKVLDRFNELVMGNGQSLLNPELSGPYNTMLSPGLINVDHCTSDKDEEIFGPILKIKMYSNLDEAISLANDTKFGLAAGIVTQERKLYDRFYQEIKAGIINWNQQLTGATTFAPFGGIKQSGNFRPAGYLSADYCSYALASFEVEPNTLKLPQTPGIIF